MKLFVWDLHGTLEQGNERAVVEISNLILAKFGYVQQFANEHVSRLYGLKWYQYFQCLLPEEPTNRHIELQAACFELSNSPEGVKIIARHMKPSQNALYVLDQIHRQHEQVLISNTIPASLPVFIEALQIQAYFLRHNSLAVNQHARNTKRTKEDAFRDYVGSKKYNELIVIGDSESDMLLAKAIGAKGYLYAHAHLPFKSTQGHVQIHDLKELLQEL